MPFAAQQLRRSILCDGSSAAQFRINPHAALGLPGLVGGGGQPLISDRPAKTITDDKLSQIAAIHCAALQCLGLTPRSHPLARHFAPCDQIDKLDTGS